MEEHGENVRDGRFNHDETRYTSDIYLLRFSTTTTRNIEKNNFSSGIEAAIYRSEGTSNQRISDSRLRLELNASSPRILLAYNSIRLSYRLTVDSINRTSNLDATSARGNRACSWSHVSSTTCQIDAFTAGQLH